MGLLHMLDPDLVFLIPEKTQDCYLFVIPSRFVYIQSSKGRKIYTQGWADGGPSHHGYPAGEISGGGLLVGLFVDTGSQWLISPECIYTCICVGNPDTHVVLDRIGDDFPRTYIKASVLSNVLLAPGP